MPVFFVTAISVRKKKNKKMICLEARKEEITLNFVNFVDYNCINLKSNDGRAHDMILVCKYKTTVKYIDATENLNDMNAYFYAKPPDEYFKLCTYNFFFFVSPVSNISSQL